jgi:hypothetical protein
MTAPVARARSREMEEKRLKGSGDTHGFLAQAMVRNPPYAGGSGQLQALYHAAAGSVSKFVFIDDWCFASVLRPRLRHPLTTAAGAAVGTEFHSIWCRTRDIANRCPA